VGDESAHHSRPRVSRRSKGLAGEGIKPEKPPYRPGGRTEGPRIAFVRDADGYRVERIERA
jgi:hypothetical protein